MKLGEAEIRYKLNKGLLYSPVVCSVEPQSIKLEWIAF